MDTYKTINRRFPGFALILVSLMLAYGCDKFARIPEVSIHKRSGDVVKVQVEVARKPAERSLGLMYRKSLRANKGMLFIFENEQKQVFVMENTFVPLDMIFIGRDKRIAGWVENARPLSGERYSIEQPSQYVVEVNAFFCRDKGIAVRDEVVFKDID